MWESTKLSKLSQLSQLYSSLASAVFSVFPFLTEATQNVQIGRFLFSPLLIQDMRWQGALTEVSSEMETFSCIDYWNEQLQALFKKNY